MLGIHDLALFVVSGLLLNLAPGPDSLLVMTRSATQGWRAGSSAALGIAGGTCVHILAAALGLSALLATSATAFTVVKLVGAAYLLYLGMSLLLKKPAQATPLAAPDTAATCDYRRVFLQGFLTNALNPKVALFFLAFVPQFIAPDAADKTLAFLLLGSIFNINSLLWCLLLAFTIAFARDRLRPGPTIGCWLNRAIGGLFVALGIKLALAQRS
ncbi:LysE family translocator [Zestomonas carbonaria]|uniref:Leucine efflux protein n=1 Tax=Zestomonas carbonaria TaxID=2762745 RepID=A0A7U7IBA1_9GAMM|nr:LysE family translocator [Pseudomonas carbonaria]CAD5108702.1 Leucine efflux protein [Pseudomonas carbonaria]